jgi:hypothetical protein
MVKINFSKIPCYVDIRKQAKIELDIKFQFANTLYTQGSGIAMGALAMKIYNSDGEVGYNEQECKIILDFATNINPLIYDSIKDVIEQQQKDEDNKE